MFFLARCAFCIGLVVFLLPASQKPDDWKGLAESARTTAARPLRDLCAAAANHCAEAKLAEMVLAGGLGASAAVQANAPRKSINTLLPADLLPRWNGPEPRS